MKVIGRKMGDRNLRKCFTFAWNIENISFYSPTKGDPVGSPVFVINGLQETKYILNLYLGGYMDDNYIGFRLEMHGIRCLVRMDCEIAFLSKDGSVLTSMKQENTNGFASFHEFKERKEVFVVNRSVYLPEDTLRVRCRIWKHGKEMSEDVELFGRTRIGIQRENFLWSIRNVSGLHSEQQHSRPIRSALDNEVLLTLDLLFRNPYTDEDSINIQITPSNGKIKYVVLHLTPLNGFGSANEDTWKEFSFSENNKPKLLPLPFSINDLTANNDLCLPSDVPCFRCECVFSTGAVFSEIERIVYDGDSYRNSEQVDNFLDEENTSLVSKRILNENMKSLFHDNILSDIKLKTENETYLAHKNILSARSPVFKAMFSNDMKEKFNECVDIEDMDSDTVHRMLRYIYTAETEELRWESACELYRAADKYEILALKEECSAYLKYNLCPNKACKVLIFADLHQDEDLTATAQEFILMHNIINTEEWKQLMKTHLKLAADTMYLQFQRKILKNKFSAIDPGIVSSSSKTTPTSPVSGNKSLQSPFSFGSVCEKKSSGSPGCKSPSRQTLSASRGLKNGKGDSPLSLNSNEKRTQSPSFTVDVPPSFSFDNSNAKPFFQPSSGFGSFGSSSVGPLPAASGFSSGIGTTPPSASFGSEGNSEETPLPGFGYAIAKTASSSP